MSHVTRMNVSRHAYEWVTPHIWMCFLTESGHTHKCIFRVNEWCHTYKWVMYRMWMGHVTHVNESCHTCEWAMSHMNDTDEWVVSHIWMLHFTRKDESCHTREQVMSHLCHFTHMTEWCHTYVMKQITSENVWLRIIYFNCEQCSSNPLDFLVRNLENVALVARRRMNFLVVWQSYLLFHFLQKENFWYTSTDSLLTNCCRHSATQRALMYLWKQSNLSAWSLWSWHLTHTHIGGRHSFFFFISTVMVTLTVH